MLRHRSLDLPLWKTVWKLLRKVRIALPCDPVILLLGMYLPRIQKHLYKGTFAYYYSFIL